MTRPLRVGIIGANPDQGWAFRSHVPAIAHLPGLTISAVATTRESSARKAGELVGAAHWYTDPVALAADPDVDLVVIAVKVPHHLELIQTAAVAGKHIYCEWPLTQTTEEAYAVTALADRSGVSGFVGLQARADAVLGAVRDILARGEIGPVMTVTARTSTTKGLGQAITSAWAYTVDAASRAGIIEIHGGHLLDAVDHLLSGVGGIRVVDGMTAVTRPTYRVAGSDAVHHATAPDVFRAGVEVGERGIGSIQAWYADPDPGTEIVVLGTDGKVTLRTEPTPHPYPQQPQMAPYVAEVVTPAGRRTLQGPVGRLAAESQNVLETYRRVLEDLRDGGRRAPRFADGVRVHEALDAIRAHARVPTA